MPASHENGFALKEGENSPIKHVIAMFVKLPLLSVRLGRLRTTESGVRFLTLPSDHTPCPWPLSKCPVSSTESQSRQLSVGCFTSQSPRWLRLM